MLKKNQETSWTEFQRYGGRAQPTVTGKEFILRAKRKTSGQKEKLYGKKKNLTAKTKTSRQKQKPHGKNKKTHGKKNNLTVRQIEKDSRYIVKGITSWCGKKKKTRTKKKNLTAKRKRLKAKRKPHGKISSIPRGHFNSYFSCCAVVVILFFSVRLFFLPWGYSFCPEVFLFAVRLILLPWQLWATIPFEILFPKILDFSTCGYLWELAQTLLIWLAFKP